MACPRYYEQNRILNLHFHREISVVIIHDRGVFCSFYATVPGYFIKEPFLSVSPAIAMLGNDFSISTEQIHKKRHSTINSI
jgi:hypothetical protein